VPDERFTIMTTLALILFMAFLLWAVVYYLHWVLVLRRFVVISPGRMYQSGAMNAGRLIRCARRHGIRTIIDFRGGFENPLVEREARALMGTGIRHINIPVGTLPQDKDLRRFHAVMSEELAAGRSVLLHCKDGEGRAVAFAAIYRIQFEGWTQEAAYRAATRLPPRFKFANLLYPPAGLLSPRNLKTQMILGYQPIPARDDVRFAQEAFAATSSAT
jgi:protein tyrosine phosphatase (PTP) superfamily phosphohydrolase (DUF442 family)